MQCWCSQQQRLKDKLCHSKGCPQGWTNQGRKPPHLGAEMSYSNQKHLKENWWRLRNIQDYKCKWKQQDLAFLGPGLRCLDRQKVKNIPESQQSVQKCASLATFLQVLYAFLPLISNWLLDEVKHCVLVLLDLQTEHEAETEATLNQHCHSCGLSHRTGPRQPK